MTVVRRLVCGIFIAAGFVFISFVAPVDAQQLRFVPDVEAQFDALSHRPDPLGFHIANSPDPTTCKHYEGIARLEGADGTPYFVLTRSGLEVFPCLATSDEPGSLTIVKMGSREKTGERLRSNRLKRGEDLVDTASDAADVAVAHRRFNGDGEWPIYGHPESMQVLGQILVVGVDTPLEADWDRDADAPPMQVLFMDAKDPEHLEIINRFVPGLASYTDQPTREINGGIVAITPQANGRYLMMLTGASRSAIPFDIYNEKIWFYESNSTDPNNPNGPTDLFAKPLKWTLLDTWHANECLPIFDSQGHMICPPNRSEDEVYAGQDWPVSKGREHQMFNFIRQGDITGTLYVAGARGGIDLVLGARIGDDIIDLYRIDRIGNEIKLKLVSSKTKDSHANADASTFDFGEANFAAASGFYISPTGEILLYATAHENDGPDNIATVGEWRHHNMVRPDSPTLLPGVTVFPPAGGEFTVNEGDTTPLAGVGAQPATKAWLELYSDKTFGGRYVVIDFLDWGKDNFSDFGDLEGSNFDFHFGFNNEASSARWFSPSNTHMRLNQYPFGDSDFPGGDARFLSGHGADADLGGLEDDIMSAQFMGDVESYYSGRPDIFWDVNLDGSFSATGVIVTFAATGLDGPSVVNVPVKSVHPVDGLAGYTSAPVRVLNVAPSITQLALFNNLNQQLGTTIPFFVEGLPVTVRGSFTDPGKPDHQTAVINWGDGYSNANSAFDSFSDAFGGNTGNLSHMRVFAGAGTFNLTLNLTDDDLGATAQSVAVPVLTQEQALIQMIETLDRIIAGTTDAKLKKILLDARKALQWNGASGALDKLRLKSPQAALIKLGQALDSLRAAQAAGANVGTLIALIEQVMASLR